MSRLFVTSRYVILLYFCTITLNLDAQVFQELLDSIKSELKLDDESSLPEQSILDDGEESLYQEYKFLVDPLRNKAFQDSLRTQRLASQLSPRVEMFGWHPHWIKDGYQHYNYNMLSTLAFFSYDINIEKKRVKGFYSLKGMRGTDSVYTIKDLKIFRQTTGSDENIEIISFSILGENSEEIKLGGTIKEDTVGAGDTIKINYTITDSTNDILIEPLDAVVGGGYPNDSNAIFQWRTSPLKDSVKNKRVNLLLTLTNFGRNNNRVFLDNPRMQEICVDSVLNLLRLNGAQGVDIDFEAIPRESRAQFSEFVEYLAKRLRADNPNYLIYLDLPAVDYSNVFDLKKLQQFVNAFVIMGYDYHGPSTEPGPIAPFYSTNYLNRIIRKNSLKYPLNINKSIKTYIDNGLLPNQLILALPHYGGRWRVNLKSLKDNTLKNQISELKDANDTPHSKYEQFTKIDTLNDLFEFDRHLTYNQVRSILSSKDTNSIWSNKYFLSEGIGKADQYGNSVNFFYLDTILNTRDSTNEVFLYNVWYDDSVTVSARYQWVINQKLKGVGFWTLGYDDNIHSTFWNTVAANFSLLNLDDSMAPVSILGFIVQYQRPIIINLLILMLFMVLGFLWALFDWKIREILFTNRTFLFIYICAFFILALLAISIFDLKWGRNISFAVGLLAGLGISLLVVTLFERSRKRIPKF